MAKLHQHRLGSRPLAQMASVKLSNTVLWSELTSNLLFCCPAPLIPSQRSVKRADGLRVAVKGLEDRN
jgi:hypothetical protein